MVDLANGAQTLTAGFWFLAQVMPKATGYSFFMLPASAYTTYQIPIFDQQYPQNPKGPDWQAICSSKFEGFKACQRPLVIPFSCFPHPPTRPIKFLFLTSNIHKTLKAQIGKRFVQANLKDSKPMDGNA